MHRRTFLALPLLLAARTSLGADKPLRVGMTPAFLHDQLALLAAWQNYLQQTLKRPVEFVQRDRYREMMDLLQQNKIDFAWVCDYPYVSMGNQVRLLAVPVNQGKPIYRSYLIVPAKDTHTRSIEDLKGAVFAYADPLSNTGYLAPRFEIKQAGYDTATFFRRTFFTWSHRKAIEAVASGLAQGAAVDSYVWQSLEKVNPKLTARTRVVRQSEAFGFPPFVANRSVSQADFDAMRAALLNMSHNPAGQALLAKLNLDGFIAGSPDLYKSVALMAASFGQP
ncbi:phosphonate ABC transporter substrate-binding protein [Sulfurimicrobium lacus]|uniref:Phosphonate ABC transporter substrate-binding protein n=1 Tax=Sulfurimicrobium lacus TaxID=2715678 RepID=A0A6F8VEM9_9PROT|nr:PhnD/SsuA/transferrin family substrate-binding protein [Sulfurimicrobium lacus]BCB27402.1 phosphonate ABC transporter substrate-binding protein [Sulfurimicrobium lacus]